MSFRDTDQREAAYEILLARLRAAGGTLAQIPVLEEILDAVEGGAGAPDALYQLPETVGMSALALIYMANPQQIAVWMWAFGAPTPTDPTSISRRWRARALAEAALLADLLDAEDMEAVALLGGSRQAAAS